MREIKVIGKDIKEILHNQGYVVVDVETTGFSADKDRIIEFAAIKVVGGEIVTECNFFINPERPIPKKITEITGITDRDTIWCPNEQQCAAKVVEEITSAPIVVGHNISFDIRMIYGLMGRTGYRFKDKINTIDTLAQSRMKFIGLDSYKLISVGEYIGADTKGLHRALNDVKLTNEIFKKIIE